MNMMRSSLFSLAFAVSVVACVSNTGSEEPTDPSALDSAAAAASVKCPDSQCGPNPEINPCPSGTLLEDVACKSTKGGQCRWKATCVKAPEPSDPDAPVSFSPCAPSECGPNPEINPCPSGTLLKSTTCGSENGAACRWHHACEPAPSTTPCPKANGCGAKPAIGVVCNDGSTGDLVCRKQGASCGWQRTCD